MVPGKIQAASLEMDWLKVWKYARSFGIGYIVALIPVLATGHWPTAPNFIAATAGGLSGMGLFHQVPPRAEAAVAAAKLSPKEGS